jgi:hypothetical protein
MPSLGAPLRYTNSASACTFLHALNYAYFTQLHY